MILGSLGNVFNRFRDDEDNFKSILYLESLRWKDGVVCSYCESDEVYKKPTRCKARWKCKNCKNSFSVTGRTLFHRSPIKINNWFRLIALMRNYKSNKIKLTSVKAAWFLRIQQRTIWSMMKRINQAYESDNCEFFKEIIEKIDYYLSASYSEYLEDSECPSFAEKNIKIEFVK